MTIALSFRAIAQAAVFVAVSRTLGVADYGAFAAILALASVFGTFGALGTQVVMLREVSLDSGAFAAAWGRTLLTIAISTPILFLAYLLLSSYLLPAQLSFIVVALIGLAEVVLTPVSLCTITAYQGHEQVDRAARLTLLLILPRFLAAMVLSLIASTFVPSGRLLLVWAVCYALSALVGAVFGHYRVCHDLGMPKRPGIRSFWLSLRSGLPFAAGSGAVKTHTEIDKTMLSRLSTLEHTGAYSAGHRITDLAVIPIVSLLTVSWPRFFRAGSQQHSHEIFALARGILPIPAVYALLAGFGLYYAATFLPVLLGAEFAAATHVLRWLAWLPLISLPRLALQMLMASSGRQGAAVGAQFLGAASNIGLNLWLIPAYGWKGAVIATYAAEVLIAGSMLFSLLSVRLSPGTQRK